MQQQETADIHSNPETTESQHKVGASKLLRAQCERAESARGPGREDVSARMHEFAGKEGGVSLVEDFEQPGFFFASRRRFRSGRRVSVGKRSVREANGA